MEVNELSPWQQERPVIMVSCGGIALSHCRTVGECIFCSIVSSLWDSRRRTHNHRSVDRDKVAE